MKMKKNDNKLLKIFDFRLFSHAVAVVIAVVISYLSQDPVIAASISTITGLVIGFAASNLIGNIIAGIYIWQ
jgi:small-conductance mechanosensitive channel